MDEDAHASDSETAKPAFTDSGLLLNHFATFMLQYKYLLLRNSIDLSG